MSQVDSSIGGKVAINTAYGKNQLGAFWPAQQVYITDIFLETLDARQVKAGMAEIIKIAPFSKGTLLQLLGAPEVPKILTLVEGAIRAKLEVIGNDWYEAKGGTRIGLNFGHTIGHALEKTAPELLHGEAVALGMLIELQLAQRLGEKTIPLEVIEKLLIKFSLPTQFHHYVNKERWSLFLEALLQDKKNEVNRIIFVVPGPEGKVKKLEINLLHLKSILF